MSSRLSKTEISDRFRACCQRLGKTPGKDVFCKTAGVKKKDILYHWPRFSDLVKECGFVPQGWVVKIPDIELFQEYAKVCLRLGKIPNSSELRIATRQFKTRTHSIRTRFKSVTELDLQFRSWLEKQSGDILKILDFPGWDRQGSSIKREKTPPSNNTNHYFFHPFLPACLQSLDVLARGEVPQNEDPEESVAVLFERRCADAFRCLGFEVENLGQGKGRVTDFLALARRERFALIVDAKSRSEGYVLGTENRKFLEYAINHGKELQSRGFDRLYLVIIASSFQDKDYAKLATYLSDSPIRNFIFLAAKALMEVVERSIRERHSFVLSNLERDFFRNKIIREYQ